MDNTEKPGLSSDNIFLTWRVWLCYGIGHVLNDVCASIWFTYLLVYFHLVLKFDSVSSGIILLIGQVADAVSTPFVGIESDKDNDLKLFKYGKRKTWHLIGTICILSSFPFIFTPCIGCQKAHIYAQLIYYAAFVVIFQFGWASVQISHLALIPELTYNDNQRTQLTSIRYGFTVASTIIIYIVTWVSLKIGTEDITSQIGPNDSFKFQRVVYIGLAIGLLTSIMFHWGVKENPVSDSFLNKNKKKTVLQIIKRKKFFQVAITYMCSRLLANLAQVYVPLFLQETILKNAESIAVIPLLMFLGSIGTSAIISYINRVFGRKAAYVFGSALGISACLWIKYGLFSVYEIYCSAVLLGISGSILIVTSLGLTADFIGFNTSSGAFVYGAMSFFDKLSNGIAVMVIQYIKCSGCPDFYRNTLVFACGGASLMGLLTVLTIKSSVSRSDSNASDERSPLL